MWFWDSAFWDILDSILGFVDNDGLASGSSGDGMRRAECTNPYILEKRRRRAKGTFKFFAVIGALAVLWYFFPQISEAVSKHLPR